MSLEDRIKATAKNIEGKVQEAVGEITGDPQQKMEGQKKQAEAEVQQAVENLKDKAKKLID
ncbi:MAG: CsbD family protein [Lyngbya sp.]|nr:CsbD family protein [Lyngbya sp.]